MSMDPVVSRLHLKCDGTRTETRFRLSAKRRSPFKSVGASVQSTAGSRGVRIGGINAGYTMFRGSWRVLATHSIRQFPLHFPSHASPCAITFQLDSITVCWWCHVILGVTIWADHISNRSTSDMQSKIYCNYQYNTVHHHLHPIQNSSLGYNAIRYSQAIYCFKFWLKTNILKTYCVSITCHSGKWPYDVNI